MGSRRFSIIKTKNYDMFIMRFISILRSVKWPIFAIFIPVSHVYNIIGNRWFNVLDNVVLRYRCNHGYEFFAKVDDYWRFIGHFEPKTTVFMMQRVDKNSVVVDVDAHIGIHTIHLAKRAKLVIAIEPEPRNYILLKKNLRLNKVRNVLTLPIALSNKDDYAYLFVASSSGAHTLEPMNNKVSNIKFVDKIKIRTLTFDSLISYLKFDYVDLVKIDVEGHEEAVLKGMRNTLQKRPPRVIIIETEKESHILDALCIYGYSKPIELDSWGKRINYALIHKR